jgi:hypothetical protein
MLKEVTTARTIQMMILWNLLTHTRSRKKAMLILRTVVLET